MRPLDLIPARWLDYEPPSLCHDIISATLAAVEAELGGAAAATGLAEAGTAATVLGSWSPIAEAGAAAASSSFPSLSTLGTVASVAGTGLQTLAQGKQAAYGEAVAKNQAAALRQKANDDTAAAQRQQITAERRAGLITSRARALAADSGTSATSPTEVTNEGRIAQQGDYNAMSSLYEGLAASRADNAQADIDLFKGQRIAAAAPLAMGSTLLSGLTQFADRRSRLKYFTSSGGDNFFGFGG